MSALFTPPPPTLLFSGVRRSCADTCWQRTWCTAERWWGAASPLNPPGTLPIESRRIDPRRLGLVVLVLQFLQLFQLTVTLPDAPLAVERGAREQRRRSRQPDLKGMRQKVAEIGRGRQNGGRPQSQDEAEPQVRQHLLHKCQQFSRERAKEWANPRHRQTIGGLPP